MAVVTVLGAFYFLFASFIGLFKFLKWKTGDRKTGIPTSISEGRLAYSFVSGQKEKYAYSVNIDEDNSINQYKYIETKGQKEEHRINLNTPVEFVVNKKNKTAITYEDYEQLKKNLFMNPICCVGCFVLSYLLILFTSAF